MSFLDYTGLTAFWSKIEGILLGKQNVLVPGEGVSIKNDTITVQEPVKGVTQEEYNALTKEQKSAGLYVITDASLNLNDRGDVYSTEETRVGTWIDGKPVYRKVFSGISPDARNGAVIFDISSLSLETIINGYGWIDTKTESGIICIPYTIDVSNLCYIVISANKNAIIMNTRGADFVNKSYIYTIEYTKTTDQVSTISSVGTQNLFANSSNPILQNSEKVLTSQVPLPSYAITAPASASSTHFTFAPASASSTHFTFAPASASSTKLKL